MEKKNFIIIAVVSLLLFVMVFNVVGLFTDNKSGNNSISPPQIPSDLTSNEMLFGSSYNEELEDFQLVNLTATKGEETDYSQSYYAEFTYYSTLGNSNSRGLVETADYQLFRLGDKLNQRMYFNNGDYDYIMQDLSLFWPKVKGDTVDDYKGIKFWSSRYMLKPSEKRIAYSTVDGSFNVCNVKQRTGTWYNLFSIDYPEISTTGKLGKMAQYGDNSFMYIDKTPYRLVWKNGYMQSMDYIFKHVLKKHTNAKNGDTIIDYCVLNDLATLYSFNKKTEKWVLVEKNIIMQYSIEFKARTSLESEFVLSNKLNLKYN
ncbi:MAG: hypothetical protein IJZ29_05340 [Clostridia bacterium]|nr:hypothetical protein [Clostridia bacterium]